MSQPIQEISTFAFLQLMEDPGSFMLVDVREEEEFEAFNIGGTLMPSSEFTTHQHAIPNDKPVVFICEHGIRSSFVIQRLQEKFGYTNLINLKGGLDLLKKTYTVE